MAQRRCRRRLFDVRGRFRSTYFTDVRRLTLFFGPHLPLEIVVKRFEIFLGKDEGSNPATAIVEESVGINQTKAGKNLESYHNFFLFKDGPTQASF